MGTGRGIGFSAVPDFSTWALLTVWEDAESWERFAAESRVMKQYRARGDEVYSILLAPLSAHGRWDGKEPFGAPGRAERPDPAAPVAVLTRATIRPSRALRFWSRVAPVDATLRGHPDLLLTFGIGEVPYLRQATLSVWRSAAAMQAWAYGSEAHAETVRRTRDEGWYSEELFARFRLVGTRGTWGGGEPLGEVR
jgi:heme-degrading monooxygenase HmoA